MWQAFLKLRRRRCLATGQHKEQRPLVLKARGRGDCGTYLLRIGLTADGRCLAERPYLLVLADDYMAAETMVPGAGDPASPVMCGDRTGPLRRPDRRMGRMRGRLAGVSRPVRFVLRIDRQRRQAGKQANSGT